METLKITTGAKTIKINRDGNYVGDFTFNPKDVHTASKVFSLEPLLKQKDKEFQDRIKSLDTEKEKTEALEEYVNWNREAVDKVWGDGTSQLLFGDEVSTEMFSSFFEGITKYYNEASNSRTQKYIK